MRFWIAPGGDFHRAIRELPVEYRRLITWTVIALGLFMAWLVLLMLVRMPAWTTALFSIALGSISFVLASRVDVRHPQSTIPNPPPGRLDSLPPPLYSLRIAPRR